MALLGFRSQADLLAEGCAYKKSEEEDKCVFGG